MADSDALGSNLRVISHLITGAFIAAPFTTAIRRSLVAATDRPTGKVRPAQTATALLPFLPDASAASAMWELAAPVLTELVWDGWSRVA